MTFPTGTFVLLANVTVPSTNPAAVIAVWAFAWVSPVTAGTLMPDATTKLTAEPGATVVPAPGLWLTTLPAGTVVLLAEVTAPTINPAVVIAAWAFAWVSPVTAGVGTSILDASSAPPAQAVTIIATNMGKNIEETKFLERLA